ncbi:COP9 signalosome complex subunit 4 [Porphyridium purpureum]|uniref:COP9 signalosome complex subunit 4 n=1 Tax=Porphyridium purpureum TaxID=35688 RepID=A0A5J4Z054_PORPP|nr:COP9 signalosome complex subunit 4 [Porphyridium purpureum]|eukprot:POR2358..scf208_2
MEEEIRRIGDDTKYESSAARVEAYLALVDAVLLGAAPSSAESRVQDLLRLVRYVTEETVVLVVARGVVLQLLERIRDARGSEQKDATKAAASSSTNEAPQSRATLDDASRVAVLEGLLQVLRSRMVSFEDAVKLASEQLAEIYERQEYWIRAAEVLGGIPYEANLPAMDDVYRVRAYVKMAQLYLEADDAIRAETYLNRASGLIGEDCDPGAASRLGYRVCYARILDAKRKFMEASSRYYELSRMDRDVYGVSEQDEIAALGFAVVCSVLAPAGPRRSRLLSVLYSDARTRALPSFDILQALCFMRLVRPAQVESFAALLKPHQLATTSEGSTILERAVLEHNVLVVSQMYKNISIEQLGQLLGVSAESAEMTASKMMNEKRLSGSIDQVDGLIVFSGQQQLAVVSKSVSVDATAAVGSGGGGSGDMEIDAQALSNEVRAAAGANARGGGAPGPEIDVLAGGKGLRREDLELLEWDQRMISMCTELDKIATLIMQRHPKYSAEM